jgi:hypothetical protein
MVQYDEVLQVLHRLGFSMEDRRKFVDRPEHWDELFSIHRRLTRAEIRMVTGLEDQLLDEALVRHAVQDGDYFLPRRPPRASHSAPEPRERPMTEPALPVDDGPEIPVRGYYRIEPN